MNERTRYHAGLMPVIEIIERIRAGRPAYLPSSPATTDQRAYLAFAAKPEGRPKQ